MNAVRFDALLYGIELAFLLGKKYRRARTDLYKKVEGIAQVANIPEIQAQFDMIDKILNTDYIDTAGLEDFEEIRERLSDLMKYIPKKKIRYDTNFEDDLLSEDWNESELENDELKNYKAKAEYYIRQHQDNIYEICALRFFSEKTISLIYKIVENYLICFLKIKLFCLNTNYGGD